MNKIIVIICNFIILLMIPQSCNNLPNTTRSKSDNVGTSCSRLINSFLREDFSSCNLHMVMTKLNFTPTNSKEFAVVQFCNKLLSCAMVEDNRKKLLVWHKLLSFLDGEYAYIEADMRSIYLLPSYEDMKDMYGNVHGGKYE